MDLHAFGTHELEKNLNVGLDAVGFSFTLKNALNAINHAKSELEKLK
jgi:hypothetical protein